MDNNSYFRDIIDLHYEEFMETLLIMNDILYVKKADEETGEYGLFSNMDI